MFLFRSLTIGLLGACIMLLARQGGPAQVTLAPATSGAAPPAEVLRGPAEPDLAIVDVAPGVRASDVPALIRLSPGERVVAVDDRRVDSDLAAGVAIANRAPTPGAFVDLEIERSGGRHRRVLVLLH